MPPQVFVLPNGQKCRISSYVASWKQLTQMPIYAEIRGWSHFSMPAGEILHQIRQGIHDRINRNLPYYGKGRKWTYEWQTEVIRMAAKLSLGPRVIIRPSEVPCLDPKIKARLAHRITHPDLY